MTAAAKEVDLARILQAIQTADANDTNRMKDLKLFLFFLPLIWGVIGGVLWFIILVFAER